jgi:hypothetical protein
MVHRRVHNSQPLFPVLNQKNPQNYWVFGLFPSSGILENTMFRKLDLFPSSGEGGGEDTYSAGSSD